MGSKKIEYINHEYTDNIVCPYCGESESDSWEVKEEFDENYECMFCHETFIMERHIEVTYSTQKR